MNAFEGTKVGIVILTLLLPVLTIANAFPLKLVSTDNETLLPLSPTSYPNEVYDNWTTFKITMDRAGHASYELKNYQNEYLIFKWKTDRNDTLSTLRLYIDNNFINLWRNSVWNNDDISYAINPNARLEFRIDFINRGGNVWIAFPQNYTPPQPEIPSPIMPKGTDSGYVGERYSFSTSMNPIDPGKKIRYEFDWGDGSYNNTTNTAEANHCWTLAGIYKVKVRAWNENNIGSKWSDPSVISIYKRKLVSDNLQNAIDNSDNYTELDLNNFTYTCNSGIKINNKH